jgi:hypothetical protein
MEQTPVEQIEAPLTAAQFKELLDKLTKQYDMLVDLNRAVAGGQTYTLRNGEIISKGAMKSYNSAFKKAIKDLAKEYTRALTKKRKAGRRGARSPSYYVDELLRFVREADFGPAYEINEQGECVEVGPLSDYLTLAKDEGIMMYNMVPTLFSIYFNYHHLKRGSVTTADELMRRVFSRTFNELYQADVANPKYRKARKNEQGVTGSVRQEPFNPDNITLTDPSRIGSLNMIKKDNLSPEQLNRLNDTQIRDEADREYNIVRSTLNCIKQANEKASPSKSSTRKRRVRPTFAQA